VSDGDTNRVVDDELRALRDEVRLGFAQVRLEVAEARQEVAEFRREVAGKLESLDDRVRYEGVMREALHSDVRLLAEGHHQLDQKIDRYRAENDGAHRETHTLIRAVYRDLSRRIPPASG